jgi:hypothetical protein
LYAIKKIQVISYSTQHVVMCLVYKTESRGVLNMTYSLRGAGGSRGSRGEPGGAGEPMGREGGLERL